MDKALLVLRSAVATGADWTTLQEYIKVGRAGAGPPSCQFRALTPSSSPFPPPLTQTEQAAGNPLARMIVGAKWNENKVRLAA